MDPAVCIYCQCFTSVLGEVDLFVEGAEEGEERLDAHVFWNPLRDRGWVLRGGGWGSVREKRERGERGERGIGNGM